MMSSYTKNELNYGNLLNAITFTHNPSTIVEIGILDGYSLEKFTESTPPTTNVYAYDIFEEFNGNSGNKQELQERFKHHSRVHIEYGDFFKLHTTLPSNIDIIHIDIANNGDIYEYAVDNYMKLLSPNGCLILEGGSKERDEVTWMKKYNKTPINPLLCNYNCLTIGTVPSLTIIKM